MQMKSAPTKDALITAKTLELALVKAANQLGVTQSEIGYRVVEEKKGFLGFLGRSVSLDVWKKHLKVSQKKQPTPKVTPRKTSQSLPRNVETPKVHERKPSKAFVKSDLKLLTIAELEEVSAQIKDFSYHLFKLMLGVDPTIHMTLRDGAVYFDVKDESLAQLLMKHPKLAESLEHILRKSCKKDFGDRCVSVFLDAMSVRQARETELRHMARELSEKVHTQQQAVVLNYKSSYERKVIHMALDDDTRVQTKSIGNTHNRKLMIYPKLSPGVEASEVVTEMQQDERV